jgi:predicted dehydrogenase
MGNPIERVEVPAEFVGGWTVERNFIDAIRSGVPAEATFNTGLKYMRFLEAVKLSYSSGRRIELSALG